MSTTPTTRNARSLSQARGLESVYEAWREAPPPVLRKSPPSTSVQCSPSLPKLSLKRLRSASNSQPQSPASPGTPSIFKRLPFKRSRAASVTLPEPISLDSTELPIPGDILLDIVEHLTFSEDILNLILTSKPVYRLLHAKLYTTVDLKTTARCRTTLAFFSQRPDITRNIQTLIVRPNGSEVTTKEQEQPDISCETWAAEVLGWMDLSSLQSFFWHGMNRAPTALWRSLRTYCPRLRSIGSTFPGLPSNTGMYEFEDLTSFSLILKPRHPSPIAYNERRPPITQDIPDILSSMLIERCPNLQELSIESIPTAGTQYYIDYERLLSGRWPNLRSLSLGGFAPNVSWSYTILHEFISAHPQLTTLVINRLNMNIPPPLVLIPPSTALSNVISLGGTLYDLAELPNLSNLEHLKLTSFPLLPSQVSNVCTILRNLPNLESLAIWVDFKEAPKDHHLFHYMCQSCPQLLQLQVSCSSYVNMETFSAALIHAPRLQSFVLTKLIKPRTEEPMLRSATRIIRRNPHLHHFTLRFASKWNSGSATTSDGDGPTIYPVQIDQVGTYFALVDDLGSNLSGNSQTCRIAVRESEERRGKQVSRNYIYSTRNIGDVLNSLAP